MRAGRNRWCAGPPCRSSKATGLSLAPWDGADSGLLDDDDIAEVGSAIAPGSWAVVVIYENLWTVALARRLAGHGIRLVADGRVSPDDVLAALDEAESTPACA